jgi:hypothetical protein
MLTAARGSPRENKRGFSPLPVFRWNRSMAALEPKFLAKAPPRKRNAPPGRDAHFGHAVHLQAAVQVAPARHLHV